MVRIRGGDADRVAEARRQLEFDVRTIGLSREQAQWLATKPGTLVRGVCCARCAVCYVLQPCPALHCPAPSKHAV